MGTVTSIDPNSRTAKLQFDIGSAITVIMSEVIDLPRRKGEKGGVPVYLNGGQFR